MRGSDQVEPHRDLTCRQNHGDGDVGLEASVPQHPHRLAADLTSQPATSEDLPIRRTTDDLEGPGQVAGRQPVPHPVSGQRDVHVPVHTPNVNPKRTTHPTPVTSPRGPMIVAVGTVLSGGRGGARLPLVPGRLNQKVGSAFGMVGRHTELVAGRTTLAGHSIFGGRMLRVAWVLGRRRGMARATGHVAPGLGGMTALTPTGHRRFCQGPHVGRSRIRLGMP